MPGCRPPDSVTVAFWQLVADEVLVVVVVPPDVVLVVVVVVELELPPPHAESATATMASRAYF